MAPHHSQGMSSLLVPLAPFAHADGLTVGDHIRHDGKELYRS